MAIERPDRHDRKVYILLGKKGEWGNDLWKIWTILKEAYTSHVIRFIPDDDEEYNKITDSKKWKDIGKELDDHTDFMSSFYEAEELSCGLNVAMYRMLMLEERKRIEKRESQTTNRLGEPGHDAGR